LIPPKLTGVSIFYLNLDAELIVQPNRIPMLH
jgi:hypothetical protein